MCRGKIRQSRIGHRLIRFPLVVQEVMGLWDTRSILGQIVQQATRCAPLAYICVTYLAFISIWPSLRVSICISCHKCMLSIWVHSTCIAKYLNSSHMHVIIVHIPYMNSESRSRISVAQNSTNLTRISDEHALRKLSVLSCSRLGEASYQDISSASQYSKSDTCLVWH